LGIVSYPDTLLLELDDDSSLRKPLLEIQKAGQKAAEIVQDLTALTRRGIGLRKPIDLNDIIQDYLESPEYAKLMSYHQNLSLKTNLDKGLLSLKGSPIHIRKTIMNLVSNAAEAQLAGGEITISTYNKSFCLSEKKNEQIREGDFVALEISDKGCGIAEEDMERIFEPFYSKKIMGRGGSGLGMAVVWATIQDHHGFIDIESKLDEGTIFHLYFPGTRECATKERDLIHVKEYMGKGQVVLIVDDDREQREIATGILEKLNYRTLRAASGDEAVEYIRTVSPDIMLLDMIMDPGIDGLETFKRVIEINPKQKAIIVTGFAETDRIKETQRLGAGQLVKKPYTIETIGLAIKNELRA
jgi:CheY-like chemotaxis protein